MRNVEGSLMEKQNSLERYGTSTQLVSARLRLCFVFFLLALALFSASCGGSSPAATAPPQGLPALTSAGPSNAYLGMQSAGDMWQASIDHTSNNFSVADLTDSSTGTVLGSIVDQIGFLGLAQTNVSPPFQPFGFALEIPDRVLLLRPGTNTSPLAALVPGSCLNINGSVTFQFVTLPDAAWNAATDAAYGSAQVRVSGTTWNLSSLTQFTLGNSSDPSSVGTTGACAINTAGGLVTIAPNPPGNTPATMAVGPSGFLSADNFLSTASGTMSAAAGVIQPSSSLTVPSVVSASYLGFIYEPNVAVGSATCVIDCLAPTQMAAFTGSVTTCLTPPSASGMCGGAFLNDILGNIKQASTDITVEFGNEDPNKFGLFKSTTITIPNPAGSAGTCAAPGVTGADSQSNPTCTLPAIAVVGNPENKFAIFIIAQDTVNDSPISIFLLQQ